MAHADGMTLLDSKVLTGLVRSFPYNARRYSMLQYFPRRSYSAGEITWEEVVGARGAARVVDSEANAVLVPRDGVKTRSASPMHIKEATPFTQKELSLLRQAGSEAMDRKARIITEQSAKLDARRQTRFNAACASMLAKSQVVIPAFGNSVGVDLDYGFPALTAPNTPWNDAGAKILRDIHEAILQFSDNAGYPPTHLFYNPRLFTQAILGNTEWLSFVKASPGTSDLVRQGATQPMQIASIPLVWVPVNGQWVNDQNALEDVWPVNRITLVAMDGALGEWASELNEQNSYDANVLLWTHEPQDGQRGVVTLYIYDNGIPIIRDFNSVQTWLLWPDEE